METIIIDLEKSITKTESKKTNNLISAFDKNWNKTNTQIYKQYKKLLNYVSGLMNSFPYKWDLINNIRRGKQFSELTNLSELLNKLNFCYADQNDLFWSKNGKATSRDSDKNETSNIVSMIQKDSRIDKLKSSDNITKDLLYYLEEWNRKQKIDDYLNYENNNQIDMQNNLKTTGVIPKISENTLFKVRDKNITHTNQFTDKNIMSTVQEKNFLIESRVENFDKAAINLPVEFLGSYNITEKNVFEKLFDCFVDTIQDISVALVTDELVNMNDATNYGKYGKYLGKTLSTFDNVSTALDLYKTVKNRMDASEYEFDVAERSKRIRDSDTKLNFMIMTLLSSFINPYLGIGVAGVAEFSSEYVSNGIGNLSNDEDRIQESYLLIGKNVQEAFDNYKETLKRNSSLSKLIIDYKKLIMDIGPIDWINTNLNQDAYTIIDIVKQVKDCYPEITNDFDLNNNSLYKVSNDILASLDQYEELALDDLIENVNIALKQQPFIEAKYDELKKYRQKIDDRKQLAGNILSQAKVMVDKYFLMSTNNTKEIEDKVNYSNSIRAYLNNSFISLGQGTINFAPDSFQWGIDKLEEIATISPPDQYTLEEKIYKFGTCLESINNAKSVLPEDSRHNNTEVLNLIDYPKYKGFKKNQVSIFDITMDLNTLKNRELSDLKLLNENQLQMKQNKILDIEKLESKYNYHKLFIKSVDQREKQITDVYSNKLKVNAIPYAMGGILTKPCLGLIGEDGEEAIIPLSEKYRKRGVELWEKAGDLIGKQHNNKEIGYNTENSYAREQKANESIMVLPTLLDDVNFCKVLDAIIIQAVKSNLDNLTEEVSDTLALKLSKIYSNMPL